MSVYTTIYVTRSKAKKVLAEKLDRLTDEGLGDMMDVILKGRLYNCLIVDDDKDNDDAIVE